MGTTVPSSTAFNIRWHLSSSDWLKPYAEITPNKADYKASISSSPVCSYGPSLTSIMIVPDSRARTVRHWPMGMFRATTGRPIANSIINAMPILPTSPAKHDCRVRAPLVGLVDDVALVCNLKIYKFRNDQNHCDNSIS